MSYYQPYTYTPPPLVVAPQESVAPPQVVGQSPPVPTPDTEQGSHPQPQGRPPAPPVALASEESVIDPPAVTPIDAQPVHSPRPDIPVPPTYLPFPTPGLRTPPEDSTRTGLSSYPSEGMTSRSGSPFSFAIVDHPKGTIVLVLGIIGLIFQPLSIVAWVMGSKARKQIVTGEYVPTLSVSIGRVLGIIGTILFIIFLLATIVFIILFLISGHSILDWLAGF